MTATNDPALTAIAAAGMEKCLAKLARVSPGRWSAGAVSARRCNMDEAARALQEGDSGAAVFIDVSSPACTFPAMVLFRPADIDTIARGFLGFSYERIGRFGQAREVLLSELGNIVLNSFVGALADRVGGAFMPSPPRFVTGEPGFLLEALWASVSAALPHSVVAVPLELSCEGASTRSEVVILVTEGLHKALAGAAKGGAGEHGEKE
jgi:hypothetical protein